MVESFYGSVWVKYLLLAGKLGLVLFWCAFLLAWNESLAEPFASLLGIVAVLLLLVNLLGLLLYGRKSQSGRSLWHERLQLLLFGVFHSSAPVLVTSVTSDETTPEDLSEAQAGGGQADQKQAD